MNNPLEDHWVAVKRILRYLKDTLSFGLEIGKCQNYTLGFVMQTEPVILKIEDQQLVLLSFLVILSYHGVLRNSPLWQDRRIASLVSEITCVTSLLTELCVPLSTKPVVHYGNSNVVLLSHNPVLHNRTKHMELDICFVREKVLKGALDVVHIPSMLKLVMSSLSLSLTQDSLIFAIN